MTTLCVPDEGARELVGQLPDGMDVLVWDGTGPAPQGLASVDMLVPAYGKAPMDDAALATLTNLSVIQLLSAGVEPWLDRVPNGVVLCNGRGIHGGSTAELAVAGMLSVLRDLAGFHSAQLAHRWRPRETDGLDGRRVLVIGAGDIGSRIAASIRPLGALVTMVARRRRDEVGTLDELPTLLPEADVVVIAVPHTPDTDHLVDARFLAALPDGALVVNIARGALLDSDALLAELQSRRLSAFLDVTDPEPLPADHPLWSAPNLTLTPHIGGGTTGWQGRAYTLVRAQAVRLHRGEALQNVVTEGY